MEQAIQKIFEYGLLGAIVIIEGFIIRTLYKENQRLQDARTQDLKDTRDTVVKPIEALQSTLNSILFILQSKERQ